MDSVEDDELQQQIVDAHSRNDTATLAMLYGRVADIAEQQNNTNEMCFYLTQAYIFALDSGLPVAADYNRRLVQEGRDTLQAHLVLRQH